MDVMERKQETLTTLFSGHGPYCGRECVRARARCCLRAKASPKNIDLPRGRGGVGVIPQISDIAVDSQLDAVLADDPQTQRRLGVVQIQICAQ